MTPKVLEFIPGSLQDTYAHIEIADGHHVTAKQNILVRIKLYNNNSDTFIATLHNVLLAPDLCKRLFSIITLINPRRTCLFHKKICTVYFGDKEKDGVTLPHSSQRKHAFWEKQNKRQNQQK